MTLESEETSIPLASRDLIQLLAETHPPRCMARSEDPVDHMFYAGKVDLIEQLVSLQEDQDNGSPVNEE